MKRAKKLIRKSENLIRQSISENGIQLHDDINKKYNYRNKKQSTKYMNVYCIYLLLHIYILCIFIWNKNHFNLDIKFTKLPSRQLHVPN